MTYFNTEFIRFFKNLAKNNNKEWFDTNRKIYEKEIKKPFTAFVDEMISRIREYEPEINIKPSDAIMRINKDIRFSKDKTPYNTHVAANISVYGKKDKSYPGFYFQLSPENISIYGGSYMVDVPVLKNIRTCIADNIQEFKAAYTSTTFTEKFGTIQGEQHKRIPPEFQDAAQKEPLIANKQFYYSATLKPDTITSDMLAETLMEYYTAGKKVNDFLRKALEK
jgi:uncharacterized protein (TIGR02453 family)